MRRKILPPLQKGERGKTVHVQLAPFALSLSKGFVHQTLRQAQGERVIFC